MTAVAFIEYLKKNDKKQVIFDLDETLVTLHIGWGLWAQAMTMLLKSYDPSFSMSDYPYWAKAENVYMQRFGDELRREIIELSYKNEKGHGHGYTRHESSILLAKSVVAFTTVHVWTSNDKRIATAVLEEIGLLPQIQTLVARNDVDFLKPDPQGFTLINKEHLPLKQFVMIGDSEADRGAAEQAGIDFYYIHDVTES